MKQKTTVKSKPKKAKKATQYSIDLDVKATIFLLILIGLTVVTVFYLGVLFGKASRDPNAAEVIPETEKPRIEEPETLTTNDLNIYDLKDEADSIDGLKEDSLRAMRQADQLINQSEAEAREEELDSDDEEPGLTEQPKQKSESEPFAPSWPDKPTEQKASGKLYTIQVIATSNKSKAEDLVRQLRIKSFEAYMEEYTVDTGMLYRVRVGKASRTKLNAVLVDLNKAIGGMGQKPTIVPAN